MNDSRVIPIGGQAKGGCPLCGKPAVPAYRPFCSKRCADLDLHKWLSDGYRIPTDEAPVEEAPVEEAPVEEAPAGTQPRRDDDEDL